MSFKSQKSLFIAAFIIVGLTIACIFALHYTVENISEIAPPPYAMTVPPEPPRNINGTDDAFKKGGPPDGRMPPPEAVMKNGRGRMMPPNMGRPPEMNDGPPRDAVRRVRHGIDAPDLRRSRSAPPPTARDDALNNAKHEPPRPPDARDRNFPPPGYPDGRNLDPAEREMMEKEMERRREMYFNSPDGPPPGYYPPPGYDRPDNYNDGQEDSYDYDYDPELEGKREDHQQENLKTTEVIENLHLDHNDGDESPDIVDEYIYEYFEE